MPTIQAAESRDTSSKLRDVATTFLNAVTVRDFAAARSVLADEVPMRMLVPGGLMSDVGADAAIGRIWSWFTDADPFEVQTSSANEVEGRAAVTYRLRLQKPDGWYLIEQQLMLRRGSGRPHHGDRPPVLGLPLDRLGRSGFGTQAPLRRARPGVRRRTRRAVPATGSAHPDRPFARGPHERSGREGGPAITGRLMGHLVVSIEAPGDGRTLVNVERGK